MELEKRIKVRPFKIFEPYGDISYMKIYVTYGMRLACGILPCQGNIPRLVQICSPGSFIGEANSGRE